MSHWFEVEVKQTKVYLVEMENDDENGAVDVVLEEIMGDEWDEIEGNKLDGLDLRQAQLSTDKDKILSL